MNFAKTVKDVREAMGLTAIELARRIGCESTSSVTGWERGASTPGAKFLIRLQILALEHSEETFDLFGELYDSAMDGVWRPGLPPQQVPRL